jgi:hypothetical protein
MLSIGSTIPGTDEIWSIIAKLTLEGYAFIVS